jgi:RNA polymerase sigma-70 factor, ECF subfamily
MSTSQVKRGAFEAAVLPHLPGLYRSARRFVPTPPDAEDLVQEAMLRAFRAFDPGAPPPNPRAWSHRILANLAVDRARARRRAPDPLSVDDEGAGLYERLEAGRDTGPLSDPQRLVDRWVERERVRRAVEGLPLWARQVLHLAHVEGFRYREIAEVLEVPPGTVMSRLSRARRALERALADELRLPDPPSPRLRTLDDRESPSLARLNRRWGALPEAMRSLAAAPPLLDAAAASLAVVVEDGALSAEVKRHLVAALESEAGTTEAGGPLGDLVAFVRVARTRPGDLTRADYEALYGDGWTEPQVLEALHVATWAPYLIGLNAALGARPPAP